jgi:polysaccharide export outer membrane protein
MMIRFAAWAITLLVCITSLAACSVAPARPAKEKPIPLWIAPDGGKTAAPAAPAAAPAGAGSAATPASNEYVLGPGDVVKITVYNNPDLATETEVSLGGRISFPLIGEVAIGGLTRSQAEKAIAARLGKGGFIPNAHVNLLVVQYRSQQISVMGEVNKPGNYPVSRATGVAEALAMAGGITAKGSSVITIIQKDGNGGVVQQDLDLKRLLPGGDAAHIRLGYDDIVFVPPLPVFYIYGEVRQPGAYPIAPEMTVRQALSVGGGLTVRGTERGISMERKGKNGEVTTRRPRLTDRVQPNDVLRVPEGWF